MEDQDKNYTKKKDDSEEFPEETIIDKDQQLEEDYILVSFVRKKIVAQLIFRLEEDEY